MLLGVYYTLSDLSEVDDGDLTVTYYLWFLHYFARLLFAKRNADRTDHVLPAVFYLIIHIS